MPSESITPEQLDLITDDPRVDVGDLGPLQLLREFKAAQREHGDLITRPLAAAILDISTQQVGTWCLSGRLSDISIGPVKFVAAKEIQALWLERQEEGVSVGGRGHKLPSMAERIKLGARLFGE